MPPLMGRGPTPGSLPRYFPATLTHLCMMSIQSCNYNSYLSPPLDCKLFEGRDQVSLTVCVARQGASNSRGCWESEWTLWKAYLALDVMCLPFLAALIPATQGLPLPLASPCQPPLFSRSGFADTVCLSLGWAPLRRGHPLTAWHVVQLWNSACLSLNSAISFSTWRQTFKTKWLTKLLFFFFNFYFVLRYSRLTNHVVVVSSQQRRDSAIHSCIHFPPSPPPIQAGLAKAFNWRKRTVTLHEPSYAFLYLNICESKDAATQNTCEKKSTFLFSRVET